MNGIFTDPWMVDFYGKLAGKYISVPWMLWVRKSFEAVKHLFLYTVPNGWELGVPFCNPLGFKHHPLESAGMFLLTFVFFCWVKYVK